MRYGSDGVTEAGLAARPVPGLAYVLGLAGLLPFLGAGMLSVRADPVAAARGLVALDAYAAVILSFLGAVHWGLALAEQPGGGTAYAAWPLPGAQRARLALGVLPALIGWLALLLPAALPYWSGLLVLILGFAATTTIEARAARRGLMPRGYMRLRWLLTAVVVAVLTGVLVLRLLGASIAW